MKKRGPLKNSKIIAGVTGSVAAYKAVELVRRLRDREAEVQVIMTSASLNFITPLSLELASGKKPVTNIFEDPLSHVKIPEEAELLIVAPATASIIGKFAGGLADDMLSASYLAFKGKTILAPAMNKNMYTHTAVQRNLDLLKEIGVIEIPPECGPLACGTEGVGRMASVECILEAAEWALSPKDMAGERVLVTAGPTREYLDPVRFISNRSSGKMGFALARVAARRGARVVLISGPSALFPPYGLEEFIQVETTDQMRNVVLKNAKTATMVVMAGAPADFFPVKKSSSKLERARGTLQLKLNPTKDILKEISGLGRAPFLIGFSAETGPLLARAGKKLRDKNLDMIVFNDITEDGAGFDSDTNKITILDRKKGEVEIPLVSKEEAAYAVFDRALLLKNSRRA